ncbi:hypothetical protein Taro_013910, partial [Colocasia esculenta]|nr:hypothetical protein [Colocasia esculenta]
MKSRRDLRVSCSRVHSDTVEPYRILTSTPEPRRSLYRSTPIHAFLLGVRSRRRPPRTSERSGSVFLLFSLRSFGQRRRAIHHLGKHPLPFLFLFGNQHEKRPLPPPVVLVEEEEPTPPCNLPRSNRFNNELRSFGGRLELLRSRRKAGNPELHPLHPLLRPEHRLFLDLHKRRCSRAKIKEKLYHNGTSVDTTWASVDTLSQNSPEGVLGRPLVSTLLGLVSTHCPSLARRALVSTLLGLVSTHCPKTAQKKTPTPFEDTLSKSAFDFLVFFYPFVPSLFSGERLLKDPEISILLEE